jgi:3'-phosphoadenosine 5'-phosphosulfate (PAPS) 3'-phosphatase
MSAMRSGEDLVSSLRELAEEAGASTMAVYQSDFRARGKADLSPVTEADLLSDAIIAAGLARLCPHIPVVSEEGLRQHSLHPGQPAQCVLEEAGGNVTDLRGESLRYLPTCGWFNPEFIAWGGGGDCLELCRTLHE